MAALALSQVLPAQVSRSAKASKGPRALGLLELASNGEAHLVPITILVDGKYFDASAYKAAPVPMALWTDTVYEAVHTGVSQGLFTVTGALQRNDTKVWMGEGKWRPGSPAELAKVVKKLEPKEPRGLHEDDPPPVLRRGGLGKPKPVDSPTAPATPSATTPQPPSSVPGSAVGASSSSATAPEAAKAVATQPAPDPDRPVLKRGKQDPQQISTRETAVHESAPSAKTTTTTTAKTTDPIQLIPAISDSAGPEPRPYSFVMKTDEEQQFRKKMLAMAGDAVRERAERSTAGDSGTATTASSSKRTSAKAKLPQPDFEDVQLRVFDLSNSNEPELILTARAHMPPTKGSSESAVEYMVALVAREDVNGEFHRALVNVTDAQHLDILPRLELIDVVDVDGDGRGELLFRRVSDAGSAFVVYRVIGDQLYALFEGTPAS